MCLENTASLQSSVPSGSYTLSIPSSAIIYVPWEEVAVMFLSQSEHSALYLAASLSVDHHLMPKDLSLMKVDK